MSSAVREWVESKGEAKKEDAVHAILNDAAFQALPYAQRNAEFVSSSKLKEFSRCPYHAYLRYVKQVETEYEEAEHFLVGRSLDFKLTYGTEAFSRHFAVVERRIPDIDAEIAAQQQRIAEAQNQLNKDGTRSKPSLTAEEKAKQALAYAESIRGKTQLTGTQGELIDRMEQEYLSRAMFPKTLTKKNVLWLMFGKVPCKAEWDHDNADLVRIDDTKTTGSLSRFDPNDYLIQGAFYFEGCLERLNQQRQVALNVVDKHPRWSRSHQWIFSIPTLQAQQGRIHQLVMDWSDSAESGLWMHVDVDSEQGREVCWEPDNQLYNLCPFCKAMKPTIL